MATDQRRILEDVVPGLSRVALLWNPTNASNGPQRRHAQEAVRVLGLRLHPVDVRTGTDLEGAFAASAREHAKGRRVSDLPVEPPTKFELIVNLATARALRMTIPPSIVARADQFLE